MTDHAWQPPAVAEDGADGDRADSVAEPLLDESGDADESGVADEVSDADEDLLLLESVQETWALPVWEPTGEPRVDEALEGLTLVDSDDVHGHAEVYSEIHRQLRDTLSDLDTTS